MNETPQTQKGNELIVELGKLIRERREEKRLTLTQLGELTGKNFSYLSKVEKGQVNISIGVLTEILYSMDAQLKIQLVKLKS